MAIVQAKQGFFVTWSKADDKNPTIEKFAFDSEKWSLIQANICHFYKRYVMPCILGKRTIHYCVICSGHCLWDEEINDSSEKSVPCSSCGLWFHMKCLMVEVFPAGEFFCAACTPEAVEESD